MKNKKTELQDEACYALANAIIMRAAKDYVKAVHKKRLAEKTIGEVEQFFRSQLFGTLTDVEPEKFIKTLQSKTEKELCAIAEE